MPANSTGRFWDCLARETQMIGHLLAPNHHGWPVPRPWIPYALDNGAFSCWDMKTNEWSSVAWSETEPTWLKLLNWALSNSQAPTWAIVPDVVGNAKATIERYPKYARLMDGFTLAVAVQDGMTPADVRALDPLPAVVCVGGSTDWKRDTWQIWNSNFPRVHVLRVNSVKWIHELNTAGVESCDGTGWNRGNHGNKATIEGLESYCRKHGSATHEPLWPYVCSETRRGSKQGGLL